MSSVVISGDTSGTITVAAPAVAGSNTLTLQAATATNSVNTLGTAVASTSGTSIDFTSLPSWIKRITVMFAGVSTSGTSLKQLQIGSGSVSTSGYAAVSQQGTSITTATSGFIVTSASGGDILSGTFVLTNISGNNWIATGVIAGTNGTGVVFSIGGNSPSLGGTLDRVRITTVNGTDTFDAGTVNILYEG